MCTLTGRAPPLDHASIAAPLMQVRVARPAVSPPSSPPAGRIDGEGISLTRSILERVDALQQSQQAAASTAAAGAAVQAGGAGGRTTYGAFLAADQAWSQLRNMPVSGGGGGAEGEGKGP